MMFPDLLPAFHKYYLPAKLDSGFIEGKMYLAGGILFNQMLLVEERGIGMKELQSLPTKHGFELPQITLEDPYLVITLPRVSAFPY